MLQEKIWGSLRKMKSGWWISMKCLRLKRFLETPSMFQESIIKELALLILASTATVDLSDLRSLNPHYLFLICRA